MKIKIWGCRGSITSPGPKTFRYGGESTCLEVISDEDQRIIIDAGSGIRKLGHELIKDKSLTNFTLLITHAHWDHLAGFPFFKPVYSQEYTINLCGGPVAQDTIVKYLKHQMEPPYFPVDMSILKANLLVDCTCGKKLCNNKISDKECSMECYSIPLNHPNGGYGYKFLNDNKKFVFLTDNELRYNHDYGLSYDKYVEFCHNADLLFHDAQYTEDEYKITKTWGHSTFKDAIDLAMEAGVKRLGLFHHDPDRSDDDIDHLVDDCHDYINKAGSDLDCFACAEGMKIVV